MARQLAIMPPIPLVALAGCLLLLPFLTAPTLAKKFRSSSSIIEEKRQEHLARTALAKQRAGQLLTLLKAKHNGSRPIHADPHSVVADPQGAVAGREVRFAEEADAGAGSSDSFSNPQYVPPSSDSNPQYVPLAPAYNDAPAYSGAPAHSDAPAYDGYDYQNEYEHVNYEHQAHPQQPITSAWGAAQRSVNVPQMNAPQANNPQPAPPARGGWRSKKAATGWKKLAQSVKQQAAGSTGAAPNVRNVVDRALLQQQQSLLLEKTLAVTEASAARAVNLLQTSSEGAFTASEHQKTIGELKADVECVKEDLECVLNTVLKMKEEGVAALRGDVSALQGYVSALHAELETTREEHLLQTKQFQANQNKLTAQLLANQTNLSSLLANQEKLTAQLLAANQENDFLNQRVEQAENKNRMLQSDVNELRRCLVDCFVSLRLRLKRGF